MRGERTRRVACALALGAVVGLPVAMPANGARTVTPKCVKWALRSGKRVCVKRARPPAKPAPPSGHYAGRTSQGARIFFDVAKRAGTAYLEQPYFDELDESCTPKADLTFSSVSLQGAVRLDAQGHFDARLSGTHDDGTGYEFHVDGRIDADGFGQGTFTERETKRLDNVGYDCTTGYQTWSASRIKRS